MIGILFIPVDTSWIFIGGGEELRGKYCDSRTFSFLVNNQCFFLRIKNLQLINSLRNIKFELFCNETFSR